jgi:hypothetical protein
VPLPPDLPDEVRKKPTAMKIQIPQELVATPLFVGDFDGYSLFEDEQLQAANIIATWARGQGLTVEDPAKTRQIFSRAARGQNAVTGKACGAPLWRTLAISRWRDQMNAKGRIEAGVYCTPTCWLDVRISLGLDIGLDDGPTTFYAAPFDPSQPWPEELAKRLDQLVTWRAPGEPKEPIAAVPDAQPIPAATDPAFDRDHGAQEPATLPDWLLPPAMACLGKTAAAGLVVQTNVGGAVERCEPFERRVIANVAAAECICSSLATSPLPTGTGRRAFAVFGDDAKVMTKTGLVITASADSERAQDPMTRLYEPVVSDPSIKEWESPQPWILAPCFFSATSNAEIGVKLQFDRDGKATSATFKAKTGTLNKETESCLRTAYLRVVAPCPEAGKTTASGVVHVMLAKP